MIKKDVDMGYAALLKRIAAAKHGTVEVGILSGEGDKTYEDGLTVLEVAAFHEFGLGVPERSFVRAYVDEKRPEIESDIKKLALQIAQGKTTTAKALEILGLKVQGGMQKRISDGIEPPLAASTIARKGSSKPLVDTGQLRSSLTYRVKE